MTELICCSQPENLLYEDSKDDARLKLGKFTLFTVVAAAAAAAHFICSSFYTTHYT